jgi:Amidase
LIKSVTHKLFAFHLVLLSYRILFADYRRFIICKCFTSLLLFAEYISQSNGNSHNTFPYNVTGHPALTINAGFSIDEPNLPIGMMLIGRHFDEVTVLRLAHAFERLRDTNTEYSTVAARLTSSFQSSAM